MLAGSQRLRRED